MAKHGSGNGSGGVTIHQTDEGGWLRVYADLAARHDDLPVFLSHALTDWFRQRPHLSLRAVVSVSRDGSTVELHAWYDQHVFQDVSGHQPKPQ